MGYSKTYYQTYLRLPEDLAAYYPQFNFDNHCYLRIALDNVFSTKWDLVLKRPAYKHLSKSALEKTLDFLKMYKEDQNLLLEHNKKSLAWRKEWKQRGDYK